MAACLYHSVGYDDPRLVTHAMCDAEAACWREDFETQEDYEDCMQEWQDEYEPCYDACGNLSEFTNAKGFCQEDCFTALGACDETCFIDWSDCELACGIDESCLEICLENRFACEDGCEDADAQCNHDCHQTYLSASKEKLVALATCRKDCCTSQTEDHPLICTSACLQARADAEISAEITFHACIHPFIESDAVSTDNEFYAPGSEACNAPYRIALQTALNTYNLCAYQCGLDVQEEFKTCAGLSPCHKKCMTEKNARDAVCAAAYFDADGSVGAYNACIEASTFQDRTCRMTCCFNEKGANDYDQPALACQNTYATCLREAAAGCPSPDDICLENGYESPECLAAQAAYEACYEEAADECAEPYNECIDAIEEEKPCTPCITYLEVALPEE